jgi:branched-chain amino acid transport system permease protein
MGFAEVVKIILLNWDSVTNGALGIQNIPRPVLFGKELTILNGGLYYLMLVYLLIVTLICIAVSKSKMGRALSAIRDDELASLLMGTNVNAYKISAFVLSACLAGFAGAFYAYMIRYIDPNTFSNDMSMMILSIVILGGRGSISGMFLGSMLLVIFPEVLRFMENYRFIIYGILLVVMMRFRPQGLLGGLSKKPYKLPKGVIIPVKEGVV